MIVDCFSGLLFKSGAGFFYPENRTETVATIGVLAATILTTIYKGLPSGAFIGFGGLAGIKLMRSFTKESLLFKKTLTKESPDHEILKSDYGKETSGDINISSFSEESSPLKKTLMIESPDHEILKSYDGKEIPADTNIMLTSHVIDGIGDLEHLVHCVHRLLKGPLSSDLKISVWIARNSGVPELAFQNKLRELVDLGCTEIYISPIPDKVRVDRESEVYKCDNNGSYKEAEAIMASDFIEKINPENRYVINVSHLFEIPGSRMPTIGRIDEYGSAKYSRLDVLLTGLRPRTFGIWVSDDPVFFSKTPVLSEEAKKVLFGSSLNDQEMLNWEIGHASLRKDDARLAWIELRLGQVDKGKNCSLAVSKFQSNESKRSLLSLALFHQFNHCVIVDKEGKEEILISNNVKNPRILRVTHQFIEEKDLPALFLLGGKGVLGGAGDTSIIRGLRSSFPVFIEHRGEISSRWILASNYLEANGFIKLKQWFELSSRGCYERLPPLITEELLSEWERFRDQAISELDIGPWVDRYIKHCVLTLSKEFLR